MRKEFLESEIVIDYARERSLFETVINVGTRLFEELFYLLEQQYVKIGLEDLPDTMKIFGGLIVFGLTCACCLILFCISGDDGVVEEQQQPQKKSL